MKSVKETRKEGFDKFYTRKEIVDDLILIVGNTVGWKWSLVIEPSAGSGNFLSKIPVEEKIGMDIKPEGEDILEKDFFTYKPSMDSDSKILVLGNPPFGKNSSMAIKFFNHAANWASVIAFVIPRTFRRISVQNKLDLNFHLIYDKEIPTSPCAFEPPMMVKCCFQIWMRKETTRKVVSLPTTHPDWEFLPFGDMDAKGQPTPNFDADFALRAYGGKCGEIVEENLHTLRPKSWHWIKSKIDKAVLINRFKSLDYSISKETARQNSIGRADLVSLYENL